MATHKSAEKRHRQNLQRQARNRAGRSHLRKVIKQVRQAVASGAAPDAKSQLKVAERVLDKAVAKGILHRNAAARHVSRLSRQVDSLGA